jgi:SAM-dependent methyltransferase
MSTDLKNVSDFVTAEIIDTAKVDGLSAPELRRFHDQMFEEAEREQRDIYEPFETWSVMKRSGHFRRMEILAAIPLGDLSDSMVADFGTGPWGFGCIFPKLRAAKKCFGFDVSLKALEMASAKEVEIAGKVTYLTTDGETIPIDDDMIDVFWAGEVIEHVREPRLFLQEIARVCRDGARVILSTPNRDAFFYAAHGLEYAVGPEHIALLNYAELTKILPFYLTNIEIHGYESSLFPSIDAAITSDTAAAVIQARAYRSPAEASGLIVEATVAKSLWRRFKLDARLTEIQWSDPLVRRTGEIRVMPLFGDVTGAGLELETSLEFDVIGSKIILLFWTHSWSGIASIVADGKYLETDLYGLDGGFQRFEIASTPNRSMSIRISPSGRSNPAAKHNEVIFYKAMAYQF